MGVALVVGLDIGGSKTHAVLSDGSRVLAEAHAGSANLASVGAAAAGGQLTEVLARLGAEPGSVVAVCAGAAGIESVDGQARLGALIGARLPGARVEVVHDTQLVLSTMGLDHGVALISGTGSSAAASAPGGRWARAGGWGYLLGDEGSGYALAAGAVRHALGRDDRGEPVDALTAALVGACGLADRESLLSHFYATQERSYWARLSSVVFELASAGDPVCTGLVAEAAEALAALVRTVCGRVAIRGPVVCAGGQLVNQPLLVTALRAALAGIGVHDVRVLDRDPVHGAVARAVAGRHDLPGVR